MATDQWSKLPEEIIHCILGFLPCTKDVVRTSCISKSWHQAWRTFPIPHFNLLDFVSSLSLEGNQIGKEVEAKAKKLIAFVYKTLKRFRNGDGMKIFNLSTINKTAAHHKHITRWLGMALDIKVEHLSLDIIHTQSVPCLITDRILSAYWLKSLKLVGHAIRIQSLNENSRVDLPLLTSLHIEQSYHINDQQLQKLLSGCPALEEIALLQCDLLSKVDISYHPNLETLEFWVGGGNWADHVAIRVRAPKLKSFNYIVSWFECNVVVEIHNSPELKSLSLSSEFMTDEWFHKFIAQFPLLENLTIDYCIALRKIRISNPLLEKIKIRRCNRLDDVVISSKKLTSFNLITLYSSIPDLSIRMEMDHPPNECMASICNRFDERGDYLMEASWYSELKEFLTRPFTFKSLGINMTQKYPKYYLEEYEDMDEEDVPKELPLTACNIENLRLDVMAPSSFHSDILNGLLSTCHPTTIQLDVVSDYIFGKFVCEELANIENNSRCYCKDDFKCWKHQLKEVKIEKINGIKLEKDLDWDGLYDLLPTLKDGNTIYFKLMW